MKSIEKYKCCIREFRGDVNLDGNYNIADIVMLSRLINNKFYSYTVCDQNFDTNGDTLLNSDDLDYLYDFIFHKGPPPVECDID